VALYQNINGVWTLCQRPYVKRNGTWQVLDQAWVKRNGNWVIAYDGDVLPPNPPEIALSVAEDYDTNSKGVKTLKTRYIKVGARLPGTANDPDAQMIRVLSTYAGKPPTTQFGGTYTKTPDNTFPNEPWSDRLYNEYGGHNDTSVIINKQWPLNYGAGQIIPGDKTYYFTGWSLDNSGNWSAATPASIYVPKDSIGAPNTITKEARFQANSGGSWRNNGFQGGDLIQQNSPRSQGLFFYGNQITEAMGSNSANITVKQAQIFLKREQDTGTANANVYLFWTDYATVQDLPNAGTGLTRHEITKIGTIAKGDGKWFVFPDEFNNNLNTQIKGLGLAYMDPVKAAAASNDFSQITSVGQNLRCGEIHVTWEEKLQ
jgi:hypothetical protein